MVNSSHIFLLAKRLQDISARDIWDFVNNVWTEDREIDLTDADRKHLWDRHAGYGILGARHAYYRQAYIQPFWRAVQYVFAEQTRPYVFDVCCGTGTQSILFALMGAHVVALDRNPGQLELMRKRLAHYRQRFGDFGRIEILQDDALSADVASRGPFDVVYSNAGVGHFLKADTIAAHYGPMLRPGGLLILKAPNSQCITSRLFLKRNNSSSRAEYLEAARKHGFTVDRLAGLVAVPRVAWFAGELTQLPDFLLRRSSQLAIQFEIIFRRN